MVLRDTIRYCRCLSCVDCLVFLFLLCFVFAITHQPDSVLFLILLILKWYCYEHVYKYYGGVLLKVDVDAYSVVGSVETKTDLLPLCNC